MAEDAFQWLEGDIDTDAEDFVAYRRRRSQVSAGVDALVGVFYTVLGLSVASRLATYVLGLSPRVFGTDLNVVLLSMVVVSLLFIVLAVAWGAVVCAGMRLGMFADTEPCVRLQKLAMMCVWFLCCTYWFRFVELAYGSSFSIVGRIFLSGLITSAAYSGTALAMIYFEGFFLKKTLRNRLCDVQRSEGIVNAMKNYRYDISEASAASTPECSCKDVFCFRSAGTSGSGSEEGTHLFTGGLVIGPPELRSTMEARTLARDVFCKAGRGSETLSFDNFSAMFPDTQDAVNAFSFFDSNNDRNISKREFHNTVVYFYMERIGLEKSVKRAEDFVQIVSNLLNIAVLVLLCFVYLVVFGAPVRELLALGLSSALALNFVANGVAADFYYNFMMLISHQFDIGDDVIVDGVDYRVHEFGLTNTSLVGENGGKIKLLNSNLWKKSLVNMTRAPEKIIVFNFNLDPGIRMEQFGAFKTCIHRFVKTKPFDYDDSFSLQARTESFTAIDVLSCAMILRCKSYKNKSKKFILRVEMTTFLRSLIAEMGLGPKEA